MEHLIALRVDEVNPHQSTTKIQFLSLINELSDSAIVSIETAAVTKKIHYHAQISVESHIKIESLESKIRRKLKKRCGVSGSEFYVKEIKDLKKHTTYILKDMEVIVNSWPDKEFIAECQKDTERINTEKKTKMKHQLLNYAETVIYKDIKDPTEVNVNELFCAIIHYHVGRDYLPPSRTLLTQYASYIITKMLGECKVANLYLLEIYKI